MSGNAAFAEHSAKNSFTNPELHATVVNRMIAGSEVVDHERIVGLGAEVVEAINVYEVDGGLIKNVGFFCCPSGTSKTSNASSHLSRWKAYDQGKRASAGAR